MKAVILVVAATIVTIDCTKSLNELRKRKAWNVDDVAGLFISTSDARTFNAELQKNYDNAGLFESKLELKLSSDVVYAAPIRLKWIFAVTCFEHFIGDLMAYIGAVLELLDTREDTVFDQKTMELIGFDESVYGVPNFLFGAGYRKLEPVFDIIYFLRMLTILPSENMTTVFTLRRKLRKCIEQYPYRHGGETVFANDSETANRTDLEKKCLRIKTEIMSFSKMFSSNTTPLINSMYLDRILDTTDQSLGFKHYVYETEKFTIYLSWTTNNSITHKLQIVNWNCNAILETTEYGFNEYAPHKFDTPKDKGQSSSNPGPIFKKVPKRSQDNDEQSAQNDINTSLYEVWPITLKTLKEHLYTHNYYLNVVQYYNIEANVITFSMIKEGLKILKGIKYELSTSSKSPLSCTVENVIKMKHILLWLKMTLDQLFIILEEKQPSVIIENHKTSQFLNLVDVVLDTLSTPIGTKEITLEDVCLRVSLQLVCINFPIIVDDKRSSFPNYYFFKTIVNLSSLY